MTPSKEPKRKEALLAIFFAGSVANSHVPALAEKNSKPQSTVIQAIANDPSATPEIRAFHLIALARSYIADGKAKTEAQFGPNVRHLDMRMSPKNWQNMLVSWADGAALEGPSANHGVKVKAEIKSGLTATPREEEEGLANRALEEALTQVEMVSDKFTSLSMYFIASRLYQRLGNIDGLRKCNKVLANAFDENSPQDNEKIRAATSILNSMAYGLIPLRIDDQFISHKSHVKPFTQDDFKACEQLKLKAVAYADRLPATDHVRRKVHRDLALWYAELGKLQAAEKQKQILFELVGIEDDAILYPQSVGCGQLVWWEKSRGRSTMLCGMG